MDAIPSRLRPLNTLLRGLSFPLLAGLLTAGFATASEPEVIPDGPAFHEPPRQISLLAPLPAAIDIAGQEIEDGFAAVGDSDSPDDSGTPPLFLITFDDDYFWLNTTGSIKRESATSLLEPNSFHLSSPVLGGPHLERYKFRKFKLMRYDRRLNLANREVLLKVRAPGKRKSLMSLELKF